MKYPYIVNKNGVWYPAGTEVPDGNADKEVKTENQPYTKTDINRMSTADLQKLAGEKGIENADSFSGADLKKMLIDLMNL